MTLEIEKQLKNTTKTEKELKKGKIIEEKN